MPAGSAAKRYAQAAAAIVTRAETWPQWRQDLETVASTLREGPLLAILRSPTVAAQRKFFMLDQVFGQRVAPEVVNLLKVLVRRGHIATFPEVQRWFVELADQAQRIERFTVTSSVPLTDDAREGLRRRLELDGSQVIVTEQVDPEIIGGLVIRHRDLVQDYSIRGRLEALRDRLAAAS